MSTLLDVLLTEQLVHAFRDAGRRNPALNAALVRDPSGEGDVSGQGGAAVRIATAAGESILVTARRISREVGVERTELAAFQDLVGYDWISRELSEKVHLRDRHEGRVFLLLRGSREVVVDGLGPAVYPLMAFLGQVLSIRSEKLLFRQIAPDVAALVSRCLDAAVRGPFFTDEELGELFEQDRASLEVVAVMWSRMNLASPELGRTVVGVLEMLLQRRQAHPAAWVDLVGAPPGQVEGALAVFRAMVDGQS